MRYKGYVVTYAGESLKINKENYFLNGICREDLERTDVYEVNKNFGRRNFYVISSGAKCDTDGEELALTTVDLMKGFYGVDFSKEFLSYFAAVNATINSKILERPEEHFEIDTSVLYIENDVAKVYNFGDLPVYFFEKGDLKRVSGKPPKTVEIQKNVYNYSGAAQVQVLKKANIPHLGFFGEDYETVPFASPDMKLRKKSYFVMCSKTVSDVVTEEEIKNILADKNVKDREKALRITDIAVEKNPECNYTVQVVCVGNGIPVTETDIRSVGGWLFVALLCACFYLISPYVLKGVSTVSNGVKSFVKNLFSEDVEINSELRWIPRVREADEEQNENLEETDEFTEQDDAVSGKKSSQTGGSSNALNLFSDKNEEITEQQNSANSVESDTVSNQNVNSSEVLTMSENKNDESTRQNTVINSATSDVVSTQVVSSSKQATSSVSKSNESAEGNNVTSAATSGGVSNQTAGSSKSSSSSANKVAGTSAKTTAQKQYKSSETDAQKYIDRSGTRVSALDGSKTTGTQDKQNQKTEDKTEVAKSSASTAEKAELPRAKQLPVSSGDVELPIDFN